MQRPTQIVGLGAPGDLGLRKNTRENPSGVGTLISAMRNQFGGHKVITKDANQN